VLCACDLYESTVLELALLKLNIHGLSFVKELYVKKMKAGRLKVPMAKAVPGESNEKELFGFLAGKVKIIGDIESPIVPAKRWKRKKKQCG
jgi:hypothetical protein